MDQIHNHTQILIPFKLDIIVFGNFGIKGKKYDKKTT